jgi:hypothetical protein
MHPNNSGWLGSLQLFIRRVDTQLLKRVALEVLKPENIQDANNEQLGGIDLIKMLTQQGIQSLHQPREQVVVRRLHEGEYDTHTCVSIPWLVRYHITTRQMKI